VIKGSKGKQFFFCKKEPKNSCPFEARAASAPTLNGKKFLLLFSKRSASLLRPNYRNVEHTLTRSP
jgi:hypothetical protein